MSDSLEQFRRSSTLRSMQTQPNNPALVEDDEIACVGFGYLRGTADRALELELRRGKEGDSISFPYSWLGPCRYHPSHGIMLLFAASELFLVTLHGRNLNKLTDGGISLYDRGLLRHRVTWIREMQREESAALPREACAVDKIEVHAVTPEVVAKLFGFAVVTGGT